MLFALFFCSCADMSRHLEPIAEAMGDEAGHEEDLFIGSPVGVKYGRRERFLPLDERHAGPTSTM